MSINAKARMAALVQKIRENGFKAFMIDVQTGAEDEWKANYANARFHIVEPEDEIREYLDEPQLRADLGKHLLDEGRFGRARVIWDSKREAKQRPGEAVVWVRQGPWWVDIEYHRSSIKKGGGPVLLNAGSVLFSATRSIGGIHDRDRKPSKRSPKKSAKKPKRPLSKKVIDAALERGARRADDFVRYYHGHGGGRS